MLKLKGNVSFVRCELLHLLSEAHFNDGVMIMLCRRKKPFLYLLHIVTSTESAVKSRHFNDGLWLWWVAEGTFPLFVYIDVTSTDWSPFQWRCIIIRFSPLSWFSLKGNVSFDAVNCNSHRAKSISMTVYNYVESQRKRFPPLCLLYIVISTEENHAAFQWRSMCSEPELGDQSWLLGYASLHRLSKV